MIHLTPFLQMECFSVCKYLYHLKKDRNQKAANNKSISLDIKPNLSAMILRDQQAIIYIYAVPEPRIRFYCIAENLQLQEIFSIKGVNILL